MGQTAKACPVEDILDNLRRLAFRCTSGRVLQVRCREIGDVSLFLVFMCFFWSFSACEVTKLHEHSVDAEGRGTDAWASMLGHAAGLVKRGSSHRVYHSIHCSVTKQKRVSFMSAASANGATRSHFFIAICQSVMINIR